MEIERKKQEKFKLKKEEQKQLLFLKMQQEQLVRDIARAEHMRKYYLELELQKQSHKIK